MANSLIKSPQPLGERKGKAEEGPLLNTGASSPIWHHTVRAAPTSVLDRGPEGPLAMGTRSLIPHKSDSTRQRYGVVVYMMRGKLGRGCCSCLHSVFACVWGESIVQMLTPAG